MERSDRSETHASPGAPGRGRRFLRLLSLAGLSLAVLVRVYALDDKPFWADEAWVALLARAPVGAILSTTSPAPPGFTLGIKAASLLPGPPEVTLRLVPLAAGIATVALLPLLAGALGAGPCGRVAALWLAAGAPALVNYSRELKHYALDLLLGTAFALLAVRAFGEGAATREQERRKGAALPWLAATVPWFSFGAVFPTAATFLWGWITRWSAAAAPARRRWATASAAFLLSFAAAYLAFIRRQAASPSLRSFWNGRTQDFEQLPSVVGLAKAVVLFVWKAAAFLFPAVWPVAILLAAVGLLRWPLAGRRFLLWWTAGTALLTAAAAARGHYILSDRFLLFAAPLLLLPAASGLVEVGRLLRSAVALPLALAVGISGFWSFQAVDHRLHPGRRAGFHFDRLPRLEQVIAAAESRRLPGEPVLVLRRLESPFRFYAGERLPGAMIQPRPRPGATAAERDADLARQLAPIRDRGWVLLTPKDRRRFRRAVTAAGCEVRSRTAERGALLWEVVRLPAAPAGVSPPAE